MKQSDFSLSSPGRLVPIPNQSPDAQFAFIPSPLPPSWKWPEHLWKVLLQARTCLASLDGTGKHLPNPELIVKPLQRREAQLSSKLEGTITDPQQQALFQADPQYPASDADPMNAYREVFNYGRALQLRRSDANALPLSLRLIRELHSVLMDGVRGSDQRPGEFRTIQNQIGKPARFVPPPPQNLNETLDAFEKYLHTEDEFDPLVRAFFAHYQFETIHPFGDGNGRVGRLLLSLSIMEWCKLSNQWLYMSAFFEREKERYMDLLFGVSTKGDWESWISFCLQGVVEQALDTEKRCDKLVGLHRDFHGRLKGGSVRLSTLVDSLFESPVVLVTRVKETFRVTYHTAKADLEKLTRLGIVEPLPDMKTITYYCPAIYNVSYEEVVP
ncbi:MAG TPA: Fic family protein [Bryobacteraceae bacterium]|jgi:Fic family protein